MADPWDMIGKYVASVPVPGSSVIGTNGKFLTSSTAPWMETDCSLPVLWSRIQESKNDPQKYKKFRNLIFEVLDALFWGLKASPIAWTFFKEA